MPLPAVSGCVSAPQVFTSPGYAAGWFEDWKRSLSTEASRLGERARQHLAKNRARQEAAEEKVRTHRKL